MKNTWTILTALAIAAAMSACQRGTPPAEVGVGVKEPIQAPQKADMSTPDKALKSYWVARDYQIAQRAWLENRALAEVKEADEFVRQVSTGQVGNYHAAKEQKPDSFARDIVEVKVESESRAVILVTIKNTSPIPAGAELTQRDERAREVANRYRYVMEKSKSGWQVAEIWELPDYSMTPDWRRLVPDSGKPLVRTLTFWGV
ncbi:UNVERIFIED_ORG: hypothetical protein LHJ69_14265 [Shinella sp. XGS7]|nr:hypothetical protein [Shinella sp. XGS7]